MRYVILGAGAVGGALGFQLAQAGQDVLMIARGAHAEAIRSHGLTLRTPAAERRLDVSCVEGPAKYTFCPGDRMLLCVKSQDVHEAISGLHSELPILCFQNGVTAEPTAAKTMEHVYASVTWLPAVHLEPGIVEVYSNSVLGAFRIGCYSEGLDGLCQSTAEDLRAAGFDAAAVPDILRWKRGKLLLNLANIVDAYASPDPGFQPLIRRAIGEAQACLNTAGMDYMSPFELQSTLGNIVEGSGSIAGEKRPGGSTWQSVERRRSTETEYLTGWICDLGERMGIAMPVNQAFLRMPSETRTPRTIWLEEVHEWIREQEFGRS